MLRSGLCQFSLVAFVPSKVSNDPIVIFAETFSLEAFCLRLLNFSCSLESIPRAVKHLEVWLPQVESVPYSIEGVFLGTSHPSSPPSIENGERYLTMYWSNIVFVFIKNR